MPGRYALIVASGAYSDPKLSRLRTPTTDAEELARVLRDPEIGDFEVELAVDEEEAALRRRIAAFFSERSRDDLLLLHFSCHGLKDDSGHLYFAATDTEVDQLDATAVSAEFVSRQMTRSRSRKVIALLDCCYSGAIARGLTFRGGDRVDLDDHLGGNGRVILTASSAMEYAFEGEELTGDGNPSVFTTAVVKALETGEADRDQDHRISVEELYDYVCEQVREVTPDQTPNMLSHLEGELFVARSSYVVPVPAAELSPELRAAIDSPLAGVRAGVVSELSRLLTGHDRSVAEGARVALGGLAEDDSRRVRAAAAVALSEPDAIEPVRTPEPIAPGEFPPKRRRFAPATPPPPAPAAPSADLAPPSPVPVERTADPAPPLPDGAQPDLSVPVATPSTLNRRGPLVCSVAGALLVTVGIGASGSTWNDAMTTSSGLAIFAAIAAAVIAVVRSRGDVPAGLAAAEPVLAGFPLGLAIFGGPLQSDVGEHFLAFWVGLGSVLLLASVLWRQPRAGRPGWRVVAIVVIASFVMIAAPIEKWWSGELGSDVFKSGFSGGFFIAFLVAVIGVTVVQVRGGGKWAALVAAVGAAALFTAVAAFDYVGSQDTTANTGPWLALASGLVIAAAGVYTLLRPDPPPAQQ